MITTKTALTFFVHKSISLFYVLHVAWFVFFISLLCSFWFSGRWVEVIVTNYENDWFTGEKELFCQTRDSLVNRVLIECQKTVQMQTTRHYHIPWLIIFLKKEEKNSFSTEKVEYFERKLSTEWNSIESKIILTMGNWFSCFHSKKSKNFNAQNADSLNFGDDARSSLEQSQQINRQSKYWTYFELQFWILIE